MLEVRASRILIILRIHIIITLSDSSLIVHVQHMTPVISPHGPAASSPPPPPPPPLRSCIVLVSSFSAGCAAAILSENKNIFLEHLRFQERVLPQNSRGEGHTMSDFFIVRYLFFSPPPPSPPPLSPSSFLFLLCM